MVFTAGVSVKIRMWTLYSQKTASSRLTARAGWTSMGAMRMYREPEREIPIAYEVDVLVAGGGVSGCAAAVSAARNGAKTLLVERNGVLGGVATAGLMANIGNAFMTSDNF